MTIIDVEKLRELLVYDQETGLFQRVGKAENVAGVGTIHPIGYRVIHVSRREYYAHRLAWLYTHGVWPSGQIDHINGVRDDNRIVNLRDVPQRLNLQNRRNPSNRSKTKVLGVCWHKAAGKYVAQIAVNGVRHHLGLFSSIEEAQAEYQKAKRELHEGCTT